MRGEAVAQRVRRRARRQAEPGAAPRAIARRIIAGVERPAARRRGTAAARARAATGKRDIRLDRRATTGSSGTMRVLSRLPVTTSVVAERQRAAGQRQRLGDAQARAVEQQQHRGVARRDPWRARGVADVGDQAARLGGRDRARHARRALGRREAGEASPRTPCRRQRRRRSRIAASSRADRRIDQPLARAARRDRRGNRPASAPTAPPHRPAPPVCRPTKRDEAVQGRGIGRDRQRRQAAGVGEARAHATTRCARVAARRSQDRLPGLRPVGGEAVRARGRSADGWRARG